MDIARFSSPHRRAATGALWLAVGAAGALLAGCGGASATAGSTGGLTAGRFAQTNLVADTAGRAAVTDPNLVNPWGISFSPTGPFWISDNGSGLSTLYDGGGAVQPLVMRVPAAGGGANGPVTGQVFNGTGDFALPGGGPALFLFASEDGILSGWNTGTNAVVVADRSGAGAIYKGLAMASTGGANFLYATNFHGDAVDVFDKSFALTRSFTDPGVPAGFAPFGIQNIGGLLYVTFAKQDADKEDDSPGAGNGYVDVFNADGTLVRRLVSQGALNSPWGLAQAPAGFGSLGNALLVGNFGDGRIDAYDIATGRSLGALENASGSPLVIGGLWALTFGNGGSAGSKNVLYFTAGPNHESNGLFGSLAPTS